MRRFRTLQRVIEGNRVPQCPNRFVVSLTLCGNLPGEQPFSDFQEVSFKLVLLILAPPELLRQRDERLSLPFCARESPCAN
jgi:hypothetical protein